MQGDLTIGEIREQPAALSRLLDGERAAILRLAGTVRRRLPSAVFLAARGTSDNAALYGHYLFETILGIPSGLASPSVVTIYRKIPRLRRTLVIGLSQSGRSTDIVRYVEAARVAGARTVAITNDARSPLADAAHETLLLHAGVEQSVAATKTYTAQLTVLSLLITAIAGNRRLLDAHERLPRLLERALREEGAVRSLSRRLRDVHIVTARGYNFATARVAQRLAATRARVIAVTSDGGFAETAHTVLRAPRTIPEVLTPHIYIVPLQLLAYWLALARGYDPDHPVGLRKIT